MALGLAKGGAAAKAAMGFVKSNPELAKKTASALISKIAEEEEE